MAEINTHKIFVLNALFEDNKVFEVPHYQRSYTWEEDLIQEFWTDVREVILDEINHEHFLGAFIFSDSEEEVRGSGPIRELIVDLDNKRQDRVEPICISKELQGHILRSGFAISDILPECNTIPPINCTS